MKLRPYQVEAIAAITRAVQHGNRQPLLQLATGLGKTVVFVELVHRVEAKGGRSLILAHRDELIQQAVQKLTVTDPDLHTRIGVVKAGEDGHDRPIVVASVQTLSRPDRLARLAAGFDLVVVDEAHHAPSDSYLAILNHLGCLEADARPVTLGVTATPERADKRRITSVFAGGVVHSYDLVAAIFIQFADPAMRQRLFANMLRALRPGGLLVLQGYTPRQLQYRSGGPQRIDHLYTEEMLREAFAAAEIVELRSYDAELREGTQHTGMAALVGMVVRKR